MPAGTCSPASATSPGRSRDSRSPPAPRDRVVTCAVGAGHRGKFVRAKKEPVPYRRYMTMRSAPAGGPGLPQERRLVTEIPGPVSRDLLVRRQAAVARGVSHVLPVFITAAGGGVLVD